MNAVGDAASLGAGGEVVCDAGGVEAACAVDASASARADGDGVGPAPGPAAAELAHADSSLGVAGRMDQRYHLILYCQLTILFKMICKVRQGRTVVVEIVVVLHFEESAIASLELEDVLTLTRMFGMSGGYNISRRAVKALSLSV